MRRTLALLAALATAGCAGIQESRLNPLGWFGDSTETVRDRRVVAVEEFEAADPRPRVASVAAMGVAPRPGGAILTATGLPPRLGYWDAELVPRGGGGAVGGTLVFDFRAAPPPQPIPVGAAPARLVTAGRYLSEQTLAGVNRIVVVGATNQRARGR